MTIRNSALLGLFCLLGPAAALTAAWVLTALAERLAKVSSRVFRACMYYITLALLLLDPVYLSLLYPFVGGGDMNGISLLVSEGAARAAFGAVLAVNAFLSWKVVFPIYKASFQNE